MAYKPKDPVIYDQLYEIFYKHIELSMADVREEFVSNLEEPEKFLNDNEDDIKDAFYTAALDAILTLAAEDRMEDEDYDSVGFDDFDDFDEEDSLLPDDSEKVHHF
jgi:hypothetical protein